MKIQTSYIVLNQSFKNRSIGKVVFRQPSSKVLASAAIPFWQLYKLKNLGVTQVIDLNYKDTFKYKFKCFMEQITCKLLGIKYKNFPIKLKRMGDFMENKEAFEKIHQFIAEGKKFTHIHCLCGLHRTGIVCAAEQILSGEKNLSEAVKYLEKNDYWTSNGKIITPTENPKRYNLYLQLLNKFKTLFTTYSSKK